MGKIFTVRVMAQFWLPDVEKKWPVLTGLAFPDIGRVQPHQKTIEGFVQALLDECRFRDWPDELKELLEPGIKDVQAMSERLTDALADWNPSGADAITEEIEEALAAMEKSIPRHLL